MRVQKNFQRETWRLLLLLLIWAGAGRALPRAQAQAAALPGPAIRELARADSLLGADDYAAATAVYTRLLARQPSPALLLRLAYAQEQAGRAPDALWALRRAYELRPDQSVLRKMDALAAAHHLTGYEYGDRYYFFTLLRRYYPWLLQSLLMVGVAAATLLLARRRRRPGSRPWAAALLTYLVGAAVAINLLRPDHLGREVIVRRPTPLMSGPTAGGQWLATVPAGQQLPVVGAAEDIWLPVRWQGARAWVRRGALYGKP